MSSYLDYTGLTYFKNKLDQQYDGDYVPQGVTINGITLNSSNITINAVDSTARIASSEKGVANGVATLDSNGLVPSSQLPSYVDDIKEYSSYAYFPETGESDKIYIAIDTGNIYRWSGSAYVQVNSSVSSAESALKDGSGNTITTTYATKTENGLKLDASSSGYIKALSISGDTITYTRGDDTTGTITITGSFTAITTSEIDVLFTSSSSS